jgi:hypothetical protein
MKIDPSRFQYVFTTRATQMRERAEQKLTGNASETHIPTDSVDIQATSASGLSFQGAVAALATAESTPSVGRLDVLTERFIP